MAHIDQLSDLAIFKLGEALDYRDLNRSLRKEQRKSMYDLRMAEVDALVYAVQQLGTKDDHQKLLEQLTFIRSRHALYMVEEKAAKARRKALRAANTEN